MRDAFGGAANVLFIAIFIAIVNGYLAFTANYNKAFRIKNRIISLIEQNEGYDSSDEALKEKIKNEMKKIGYNADVELSLDDYDCVNELGYCVKEENAPGKSDELEKKQYTVVAVVNVDIPVFRNLLPKMKLFQVSGTTKAITQH